jgi:hypothetical protein
MAAFRMTNEEVGDVLDQVGDLLEAQHASPYRVQAYHQAARTIRALETEVAGIVEREGRRGLELLPAIGKSIAAAIDELCHRGRLALLDRLLGEVAPEDLFTTVPGIGEALARRIQAELGVQTFEELELAAHDGRLERIRGFGRRRVALLRGALGAMLARSARSRARLLRARDGAPGHTALRPDVALLLLIDARYRRLARTGRLRRIAPRRFNPQGRAWLPVMHAGEGGFFFTAMFSNTARAHELGRTGDWVILYYEQNGDEGQCTVVTETHGALRAQRVVRGRERECAALLGQEAS